MKLYIDTSQKEKLVIKLDNKVFEKNYSYKDGQLLLPFIDEILKSQGKTVKDIDEIEINRGPGSFTGLRVAASVANTLAWLKNVPVNGKQFVVDLDYAEPRGI